MAQGLFTGVLTAATTQLAQKELLIFPIFHSSFIDKTVGINNYKNDLK